MQLMESNTVNSNLDFLTQLAFGFVKSNIAYFYPPENVRLSRKYQVELL